MPADETIMLENTEPTSEVETPQPESQPTEQTEKPAPANPPAKSPYIPRARFDDINDKYRDLQSAHSTLSTSYQTVLSERDTMKTEADTAKARAEQLESVMNELLAAKVEALPEDKRDLIPDGLTVGQKLAWLEKAQAKGIFTTRQQVPVGTPTNPPSGGAALNMENMSPSALLMAGYGAKK